MSLFKVTCLKQDVEVFIFFGGGEQLMNTQGTLVARDLLLVPGALVGNHWPGVLHNYYLLLLLKLTKLEILSEKFE